MSFNNHGTPTFRFALSSPHWNNLWVSLRKKSNLKYKPTSPWILPWLINIGNPESYTKALFILSNSRGLISPTKYGSF